MKYFNFLLVVTLALILSNCSKDESFIKGSRAEIINFTSEETLNSLERLGFIINEGAEPPTVNGTYIINPRQLAKTELANDIAPGTVVDQWQLIFSKQDNSILSLDYDGQQLDINDNPNGGSVDIIDYVRNSLIIGNGDNFTALFKAQTIVGGYSVVSLNAISGKLTANGIENIQQASMFLDTSNAPAGTFAPINQGRMFKDQDGLAIKII